MKARERTEEERELDRRIDLVNVVFGAALGGYIGNVLGSKDLNEHRALVLAIALVIFGVAFFFVIRGDTYLDMTALAPIAVGWACALIVILSAHVLAKPEAA